MHLRMRTLAFVLLFVSAATAQEIRPGVWAGSKVEDLPVPTQGYQAYLLGEFHGVNETWDFMMRYLAVLHTTSGLRDVALEEKSVYEDQAQAYVEGRSNTLPESLCLRADLLGRIRTLNASLKEDERIRVHFVDVDSPPPAMRQHLLAIKQRIPEAADVSIPEANQIKENGLETVARLRRFHLDSRTSSELRTVEYSIRAYQQGFEADVGRGKGSPYIEERDQAVASNIEDLLHTRTIGSILVLYGLDHVSRAIRTDGGPERKQSFAPMALRLQQAGIKVFCIATLPLSGRGFWRGLTIDTFWSAKDASLHSGETFDKILASVPQANLFYVDTQREHLVPPSTDQAKFVLDAFIFFPTGTPMANRCAARSSPMKMK